MTKTESTYDSRSSSGSRTKCKKRSKEKQSTKAIPIAMVQVELLEFTSKNLGK